MKVHDPGHCYALRRLDDPSSSADSVLLFVKREGPKYPGNVGHYPGTTMQEVLRACIDRAKYVNGQIPCWQTRVGIYLMGVVVWLFEHRAAKRHDRMPPTMRAAIYGPTCWKCGHVGCDGTCHE